MKKMAIIKDVSLGVRDISHPIMSFMVYTDASLASLQCLCWEEAGKLIKKHMIEDVLDLNGKPCWVEDDGNKSVFIDLIKI